MPKRPRPLIEYWPGYGRLPFYYSRPDLRPPRLNILTADRERATPGYIFVSPSFSSQYRPDSGPYIFDTNGTLIWSGINAAGGADSSDVHGLYVCQYRNTPHLCFWRGQQRGTHGGGMGVIMDSSYNIVRTMSAYNPAGVDFHEFLLTSDNTALITTYPPRFIDALWTLDSCFEDIPLFTDDNRTPFQWCASEHLDFSENPSREGFIAAHKGQTPDRSWDPVHLNSVDKTSTGDYLISARHLDSIMLVSHLDGSIIWRLGGAKSSFKLDGFNFTRQHDARFLSDINGSGMIISLFNNNNDGATLKNNPSRAMVVVLDMRDMSARQLSEYGRVPVGAAGFNITGQEDKRYIDSNGMGNVQLLPNGHVLAHFGRHGAIAEYPPEGDSNPVFFANLLPAQSPSPPSEALTWSANNYRAFLYPLNNTATPNTNSNTTAITPIQWEGKPTTRPDLWTYARTPNTLMTFYVSWNGDTRTASYKFHVSLLKVSEQTTTPPDDADFQWAGTWPRTGFETNMTIGGARPWAFAEALDAEGRSLANSSKVRTYVPAKEDWGRCGKWHCFPEVMTDADVLPLVESLGDKKEGSLVAGGDGGKGPVVAGEIGLGVLGLVEHVFALVGLGLCAWWVWKRASCRGRGWRASTRGYKPVGKEESEIVL
ncbi:hypothetical protein N8I77_007125 [Diaporthe amygdali]|uniref:ASST-domain-containing protein n=1 Tax=Phomopsis amygdali TaxID=1214568 RepID=A0AAD9SC89_PHOAM|nr:hypothetical protein N8I77_007125 [Diaporthe amygdali]